MITSIEISRGKETRFKIVEGRVQTRSLEVHIVDHCNLRCWGCCSLSPLLPKWCIDPRDLESDLQLAQRALAPTWFKLVGGEPLLHPQIDECIAVARRLKVAPILSITTNGFLLPRMSEQFWSSIDALTISIYPEPALPKETMALIELRAGQHGIRLNLKRQDSFVSMDLDKPREDGAETDRVYRECWLRRRCHIVSRGRFFTCTRPPHFQTLFGNQIDLSNDGVALTNDAHLAEQILDYLHRPEPLETCARCCGGNAEMQAHRQLTIEELRRTKESLVCR